MSANDLTRCSTLLQLFLAIVLRAAVAAAAVELRLFDDLGMAEKKQEPKKRRFLKKNGMFHVSIALDSRGMCCSAIEAAEKTRERDEASHASGLHHGGRDSARVRV